MKFTIFSGAEMMPGTNVGSPLALLMALPYTITDPLAYCTRIVSFGIVVAPKSDETPLLYWSCWPAV